MCAQMMMHAIAHRGCTDTVQEYALEVDSGTKIPCCTTASRGHVLCPASNSWNKFQSVTQRTGYSRCILERDRT